MKKVFFTRLFLLLLMVVGMVPCVWADQYGHEKSSCFSAYEKSPGVIHFKILMARKRDGDDFRWLASASNYNGSELRGESYVYMSYPGNPEVKLFHFYSQSAAYYSDQYGDDSDLREFRFSTDRGHTVITSKCVMHVDASEFRIDTEPLSGDGNERAIFVEFDWYMPMSYLGISNASFSVKIECKGSPKRDGRYYYSDIQDNNTYYYTLLSNYNFPDTYEKTVPEVTAPQLALDMGDGVAKPGQLMMVLTNSKEKMYSYKMSTEENWHYPAGVYSATIYVDSQDTVRTDSIYVSNIFNGAEQKISNGTRLRDEYETYFLYTKPFTIPAYHKIYNFQADWKVDSVGLRNGDVRLSWEIHSPNDKDIMPNDMFIIERATTADFSDAQQINMLLYKAGLATYEYIDTSDEVKRQNAESGSFYYRVRRASASTWTDMQAVMDAGLAAQAELKFSTTTHPKTPDEARDEISENIRKALPEEVEYLGFSGTWRKEYEHDSTSTNSMYLSTVYVRWETEYAMDLDFWFTTNDYKAVNQLTVYTCEAEKADDWTTSRKVNLSAQIPKGLKMGRHSGLKSVTIDFPTSYNNDHAYGYRYDDMDFTPYYVISDDIENGYWDTERTSLYLVRRVMTGNDTVEIETLLPKDAVRYNPDTKHYEVHAVDVADVPCARYEYYFRVDASKNPLPVAGDLKSQIATSETDFYFNSGMHISSLTASDRTSPDFTSVEWQTTGGDFEQYEVWRTADTTSTHEWSRIATVEARSYLDRKAPIGVPCLYKVVGSLTCDGTLTDTSAVVHGQRDCYGSVSGYVTYLNGTVRPGTWIHFLNSGDGAIIDSVMTDDNGYYYKDSLWFCDEGASYDVVVLNDPDNAFLSASGAHLPLRVSLNGYTATITDINIEYTQCKRMEGRILYEHSTVPVPHVHFLMDGRLLKDKNGNPLETNASGNFDLMVESGKHTIQAVKEGHTFANEGYFTDEEGNREIHFTDNFYGKRLYDQTRVRLAGRLTGGVTEGSKTLGLGQSVNTLGDDLTLVLELEGDNISHFVYYPTHPDITETDTVFSHLTDGDSTCVHTAAKRIVVKPDVRTGEYMVELFPARYRVTQVYANGYSTLFPTGMTSQAIDMSDATHIEGYMDTIIAHPDGTAEQVHLPYHYRYQITYRNPINLRYQQIVNGLPKDYLGEEKMAYTNILRGDTTISLLLRDSLDQLTGYVFGYPVFSSANHRNKYTYRISAVEDYYYNGDMTSARHWQEYVVGHELTLFNGMSKLSETHRALIDPVTRSATIEIEVNNPSFVQTGDNALRQVEIGMEVDGLYVYAEPIRGFVSGTRAKGIETLQTLSDEINILDVIRDPYGAHSYSYVESGTTYTAKFHSDMDLTLGLNINASTGPNIYASTGAVAAPMGVGAYTGTVVIDQKTLINVDLPIQFRYESYEDDSYSFTTTERIQTSSDPGMVGADADIYIGTMHHAYAGLLDAVTIIDSTQYRLMQPAILAGVVHLLATPTDSTPYYLVVGEQTEIGMTRPVEFAYTQTHILNVILPRLVQQRNALLRMGTHDELQAIADATDSCFYRSLVEPTDSLYGLKEGYEWIKPNHNGTYVDEVERYNKLMLQWVAVIEQNEKDKVDAINNGSLLNTYALTSGVDMSYRETSAYTYASDWHIRWGTTLAGIGGGAAKFLGKATTNSGWFKELVNAVKDLLGIDKFKTSTRILGYDIQFDFSPIIDPKVNSSGTSTFGTNKSSGFVLSTSAGSYEDISVYRVTDDAYNTDNEEHREDAFNDVSSDKQGGDLYADYVFTRHGGATHCPYEGEETTIFYSQGKQSVQLAAPTLHIDRPALSINVREQSNVPMDQPATFVLTIANESDLTYDSSVSSNPFILRQDQSTNPDGLIIKIDGQPLTADMRFFVSPGQTMQKTMQVYRGTAYDYDSVRIILRPECDGSLATSISFNVHYQPVSCPVSLTLPVQNWIMNTLSPKDDAGFYLPVEISGFDIHYDNFDHIDFQYKLKTQSDDQWTTQCSFYADSARYEVASGNKAMIENGLIRNVRFYGERDPMEQQYDLRAVSYCRLGNDFITRASDLRSGLKDTRVPQIFGMSMPQNGVLQVGDCISIPFSENIAANYLDEDYNFEVIGYTNQSSVNQSTSITFSGEQDTYAASELNYNLSNKNFSIDMILMPASQDESMTYFMQGNQDTYLSLGQVYDKGTGKTRLSIEMVDPTNRYEVRSTPQEITTDDWMHVVATYNWQDGTTQLYLNGRNVTDKQVSAMTQYAGVGPMYLGANAASASANFEGRMLEVRIWDKCLSDADVMKTDKKQLSGYESALATYYMFDEGAGTIVTDKVGGAFMRLNGLSWTKPEGRGLAIDNRDIHLKADKFVVGEKTDFTYTMWFRIMENADSVNLFSTANLSLTLKPNQLILREPNLQAVGMGQWMDQEWHFLAVTANHSTGIGSLFVDNNIVAQFNSQDVQGPDSEPIIGPMKGEIDDITFWELALPSYYLLHSYRQTPNNTEMGLLVHLSFSERVLSEDGDHYSTVYNPYNERVRKDELGNVLSRTEDDRVVLTPDAELSEKLVENAPLQERGDLVKLGFSWIGKDNELVINLKMLDKEINKQNVFVTVRNVEDLAGNPQASPISLVLFVDRNQLRWSEKHIEAEVYQGEDQTFKLDLLNQGGTLANYYIENLPWWLTTSADRGSLSPLEQRSLTLRVSDKLDPGVYETIIYLSDDNELNEPLFVSIVVKAHQPNWKVNTDMTNGETMNLFAQVQFVGAGGSVYLDTDTADIVAAFLGNTCIDAQHIIMQSERSLLCMSLLGSNDPSFMQAVADHQEIRFFLWRASTGKTYALSPIDTDLHIYYEPDTWVGRPSEPILFRTTDYRTQQIDLQKGWNWISFYIDPDRNGRNFADALTGDYEFHDGDFIKWANVSESYEQGEWIGMPMQFYKDYIYMIRVGEKGRMGVQGFTTAFEDRVVTVRGGWNHLPYINEETQDINTALASYRDLGKPGDVVKSYSTFAMLDDDRHWVGSLTHLQPGVGYMLYRQDSSKVVVQYQTNADQLTEQADEANMPERLYLLHSAYSHNMPLVASVEGAAEGDLLTAYVDNQVVGMAEADAQGRFMMLTSTAEDSRIYFRYQSADGVQTTAPQLRYQSTLASVGTVSQPYPISFQTDMATAYPDPFVDYITYSGVATEATSVEITLYSADGHSLWHHSMDVPEGLWQLTQTGTTAYPQGLYIAVIRTGDSSTQVKLIKE